MLEDQSDKKTATTLIAAGVDEKLIAKFVQELKTNWEKGSRAIMANAKTCARADFELTEDGKERLFDGLKQIMGKSKFSKYAKIGNCKVFELPHILKALPTDSFSILYELSSLSPVQIQEWVEEGVINPSVTREEILRRKARTAGLAQSEPDKRLYATVKVPLDFAAESSEKLTEDLAGLASRYSAYVELEEEKLSKLGNEYWEKVQRHVRRAAQSLIKKAIDEDGRHSAAYKKAQADQLRITSDFSLDQVQANLSLLSIRTSLQDLIGEAYGRVAVPPLLEGAALDGALDATRDEELHFSSGESTGELRLNLQPDVGAPDFSSFK